MIGKAAHICAAAPGGPRYRADMTPQQRSAIRNAIWLCSNCAADIDRDVIKFSEEILRTWKTEAERVAADEIGKPQPKASDAVNMLMIAMTGNAKEFFPDAIPNTHKATNAFLEHLDPRIKVESRYLDGATNFILHPQEEIQGQLVVGPESAQEFIPKLQRHLDHGEPISLDMRGVKLEGSKLFEEISSLANDGLITIRRKKRAAIQRIELTSPDGQQIQSFEDCVGEVTVGTKSFTFVGSAYGKIFGMRYQSFLPSGNRSTTVNMSIDYHRWQNCDVRYLPHFERLSSFFSRMIRGWKLKTSLEIDGLPVTSSGLMAVDELPFVREQHSRFEYVIAAQKIATLLNVPILWKSVSVNGEAFSEAQDVAKIAQGLRVFTAKNLTKNPTAKIAVTQNVDTLRDCIEQKQPFDICLVDDRPRQIYIFDQKVDLPALRTCFEGVVITPLAQIKHLHEGDVIDVELTPTNAFKGRIEFVQKGTAQEAKCITPNV